MDADSGGHLATLFRVVRLVRVLRILKILRYLRQAYALYLLALGFAEAALAVFWVTIFMTCILYLCAVIVVRVVNASHHKEDPVVSHILTSRFGDVRLSMFSLFQIMLVPDLSYYHEVLVQYPLVAGILIVFIILGSFGITAIIMKVISE